MQSCKQVICAVVLTVLAVGHAFAQGTTTSAITGTVTDGLGGVIPGATVTVTGDAGVKSDLVSNASGQFSVPALMPGTYKVTVALQGFKTAIIENVRVIAGNPTNVNVKLEVGRVEENVTVRSSSELVNTQTATVSSTLNADQLNRMPTASRNALNAVTFLPGVNTPGVNRDSTINGLPQSMINITLDGVSNQDNFNKTGDGFFASVYPRQDAVEAVTVTTAVAGVNQGGSGAVTINFTTRSGTSRLAGSAYEYFRHPSLNTNNWANQTVNNTGGLPKNDTKLNQYGVRVGGPLKIPGLLSGNNAFYFFHYEELRFPNNFTKTRSAMRPDTFDGTFRYTVGNETRSVNLMAIAAANAATCIAGGGTGPDPCKATFDADTRGILDKINNAMQTTGVISTTANPMQLSYSYQSPATLLERQPTGRLDFNLSAKHRLTGSMSSLWATRDPDYLNDTEERFPGAPNYRKFQSTRPIYAVSLRSTLTGNMVNEARVGLTSPHGNSAFGQPTDPNSNASSFADIGGYAVVLPFTTDWWTNRAPSWRAAPTYTVDNSLNWQNGKHSFNVGGGYLRSSAWENAQTIVPSVTLGMSTATCTVAGVTNPCDPAFNLFTATTIPGASATNLTNARAHFAQLTGRITQVSNQVALDASTNQYVPNAPRRREGAISVWSAYAQDSWRVLPTVTISGGVRWDVQTPFVAANDTMSAVTFASVCGMSGLGPNTTPYNKCAFNTRQNAGVVPEFIQLSSGTKGYNTDWNNIAPSISVAWRPNVQSGFLRALLGDPETATLRGGYSETYERQGLAQFTGIYGGNPGSTLTVNRNVGTGTLVNAGETWPLLYRDRNRLYDGPFPTTVVYPIAPQANRQSNLFAFAPDLQIGRARSWTIGFQRSISSDMAAEIRYVGTRGVDQWSTLNYNTRDLDSNGFANEFKLAMANLKANNQSGVANRAGSFAFFGAGTGTNPLPIYMAYLVGAGNPNSAASYTGTTWTSTGITQDMVFTNPNLGNSAADLDGDSVRRANAIAAGLPANFFVLNPAVGVANVIDSGAFSDYHAVQLDLRRRLSQGLSASVNYQWATEAGSAFDGFQYGREMVTAEHIRHAVKTQWDWTLPVGRNQRFLTDAHPVLDAVLGGWSFKGVGRFQVRAVNFGNVSLVGMTKDDVQDMYRINVKTDPASSVGAQRAYYLPDDVILNTRRAFSVGTSTANGYSADLGAPDPAGRYFAPANSDQCLQLRAGDCAPRTLIINAPWFARVDVGVSKRFGLKGRSNVEVAFEVLNLLDNINFTPPRAPGTGETIFSTRTIYQDTDNTYDPGGRLGQLMFRINW